MEIWALYSFFVDVRWIVIIEHSNIEKTFFCVINKRYLRTFRMDFVSRLMEQLFAFCNYPFYVF